MQQKAIIIGAGYAGLVAGAYLSRAGYSVQVFEQSEEIGGITGGFRKNGYYWDMGQLNIEALGPGELAGTIIDELGLRDQLKLIPAARLYTYPDFALTPPADYSDPWWRKAFLLKQFPEERRGIHAYYRYYKRMRTIVTLGERAETSRGLRRVWQKAGMYLRLLPLLPKMNWSARQLMDHFFDGEQIKAVFTSILADFVVKPEEFQGLGVALVNPESAFDARVPLDFSPIAHQPSYTCIDGGCRKLADLLADLIRNNGGEIYTGARVTAIRTANSKATGVTLADGRGFDAPLVIASGGARETFSLLDPAAIDAATLEAAAHAPLMESVFMLHLGLNMDPAPYLSCGINYCYRSYDISGSVNRLQHEDYHEGEDGYLIYVPSMYSPQSAPQGRYAVTIYTVAPNRLKEGEWSERSADYAKKLIALASEKIPNLGEHIVEQVVFTPEYFQARTMQAHHSFGGCAPVMHAKVVPNRTSVEGFWFIGAQSESGAGIGNVLAGARRVCRTILQESEAAK